MKKSIVIIGLILLGITAYRVWRIQAVRPFPGTGAASVEAFPPISSVSKWAGAAPAPALNAVFDIVPEKEKGKKTRSAGKKAGKKKKTRSKNAGKSKSLPRLLGVFSEEGRRYALIERKAEKAEKKGKKGGQSIKPSRPGYILLPEGGEVESYLLAEILPTRVLFKVEGGEDFFVDLFQRDEKAAKEERKAANKGVAKKKHRKPKKKKAVSKIR